jgi:transposase
VQEGQLLMTQAERDRLVALKKAKKKLITQKEAAQELGVTERHVRRLLGALKRRGDKAVVHALRGLPSHRKLDAETQQKAIEILSRPVYRGFGPTLASEYLAHKHQIKVSRETVRHWMIEAKLWRAHQKRIEEIHQWRQRRSRYGELVQWDTSDHDWLEGRGDEILLINMIDDATGQWLARFVASDSTVENMNLLERYLKQKGRPLAFYTDKASLFQTAVKTKRDVSRAGKDRAEMPPTQIGRALQELGITWIPAHSPQAKGRVERGFLTAQDRLVKGLRVAGATTLEQANHYLETEFLPWVKQTIAVVPASPDDAHRPLEKHHDLAAILSHVETRQVHPNYTLQWDSALYLIAQKDVSAGLRHAAVRTEKRRDGSRAVRFQDRYLSISECEQQPKVVSLQPAPPRAKSKPAPPSQWNKNFDLKKAPKIWQVAQGSGSKPGEDL